MSIKINSSIILPCGTVIENRLVKSAMTERISDVDFSPTIGHERLYSDWSETGAGLLITGNVVIDRNHLESAGNVCFDREEMIPKLKRWSKAGTKNGNHFWVQISHSGRQTNIFNAVRPKAPSEVQLKKLGLFGKPREMSEEDIEQVINGFVRAADIAKRSGFTGVQIHSAHGYLLSQFLSPRTNQRNDKWGGSIENRSRLLRIIIEKVRKTVGAEFPISVKLNSSDFQRGGFTEEDSLWVVKMLDDLNIDLLEISGGTYEKLAFFLMNEEQKESTKKREAYFIDFAKKIREVSNLPLMITGGFRSYEFCNEVLSSGELDLIGMARPFITNVHQIKGFINGEVDHLENLVLRTGIKNFEDGAEGGFYARQLIRLSKGKPFKLNMSPLWCSSFLIFHEFKKAMAKKIF
ncbi:NADH:flavin oxidoreductase/NADH oxidase family protein [Mangrovivirga sp. M17]|uniref:NADH:flavin oxidoreductase/NADH oxidase family protein n=1 Tax=Mangrovivirga halotolerans TaxID=2993936 RepID=A0ABT3RP83_9BACT|nr:NADH:flavin oxidoreductase/NADH oxidase family protein [Mangrovivirga halotolerans]MCX2743609.1 NADH:flavin oxidoreductase/NADH oxidase family protein [Mangrovivirga halotolerans]